MPTVFTADSLYNEDWIKNNYVKTPELMDLIKKTIINFKTYQPFGYYNRIHMRRNLVDKPMLNDLKYLQKSFTRYVIDGNTAGIQSLIDGLVNEKKEFSENLPTVLEAEKKYKTDVSTKLKELIEETDNLIPILTNGIKLARDYSTKNKFDPNEAYQKGINDANEYDPDTKQYKEMDPEILKYSGTNSDGYANAYVQGFTEARKQQDISRPPIKTKTSTFKSWFGKSRKTKKTRKVRKTRRHARK